MLVSKEKAELITKLSYEYCKSVDNMDNLITYKKALEFDDYTANRIIEDLTTKKKQMDFKKMAVKHNAFIKYIGECLSIIDNYQYLDYFQYELIQNNKVADLEIKFVDGEVHHFYIDNLKIDKMKGIITKKSTYDIEYGNVFYIPHVYDPIFIRDDYKVTSIQELEEYLKLLIVEDRLVSPYIVHYEDTNKIIFPMKERLEYINIYNDDINFINNMLELTGGYLPFDMNTEYVNIETLIEYLQYINKEGFISLVNKYKDANKLKNIKFILFMAEKDIFGLVAENKHKTITLL